MRNVGSDQTSWEQVQQRKRAKTKQGDGSVAGKTELVRRCDVCAMRRWLYSEFKALPKESIFVSHWVHFSWAEARQPILSITIPFENVHFARSILRSQETCTNPAQQAGAQSIQPERQSSCDHLQACLGAGQGHAVGPCSTAKTIAPQVELPAWKLESCRDCLWTAFMHSQLSVCRGDVGDLKEKCMAALYKASAG